MAGKPPVERPMTAGKPMVGESTDGRPMMTGKPMVGEPVVEESTAKESMDVRPMTTGKSVVEESRIERPMTAGKPVQLPRMLRPRLRHVPGLS